MLFLDLQGLLDQIIPHPGDHLSPSWSKAEMVSLIPECFLCHLQFKVSVSSCSAMSGLSCKQRGQVLSSNIEGICVPGGQGLLNITVFERMEVK